MFQKEYDGVLYNAPTEDEWNKRIQAIKDGKVLDGINMREFHEQNKREKVDGLSDSEVNTRRAQDQLATVDGPGFYRGFVSGLTNDEALGVQYLFERRFPGLAATGGQAEDYYFYRKDDEGNTVLSYMDPQTQVVRDEFADIDLGMFDVRADNFFGWAGPLLSFVTEGVGSTIGMTGGALIGVPAGPVGQVGLASVGGSTVGSAGRALGDGVRAGVSALLDGPPLNREIFEDDLAAAAIFGAVPIGAGITSPIRGTIKTINAKFGGEDGKTALKALVTEGGEDVDAIVKLARDKYDIQLTRAEAQGIKTNAGQIQRYLSQQPTSQRLFDFYLDRANRMEDALDKFFDEIQQGKYFKSSKLKDRFDEMDPLDESAAVEDLMTAYDSALKKMLAERRERADSMYGQAFKAADEEGLTFDLSDIRDEVRASLNDPQIGNKRKAVYKEIDRILSIPADSKVSFSASGYKDNLRSLDEAVKDLSVLLEEYDPGGKNKNKFLYSIISNIKGKVNERLKSASPAYAQAKQVFSEDTGHLDLFSKGFLGAIAKAIQTANYRGAAGQVENMFRGTVRPGEIRKLKEVLQAEDPRVWQNLKANWLRTKLSKAIQDTTAPFGVPNKFLSLIGVRNPKRAFGRAAAKQRSKELAVFREILEPKELQNFQELTELAQAVSYIATQSTSATQPLQALSQFISREADPSGVVMSALRSAIELPQRLVIRGFDDIASRQAAKQKEAYEDVLITALIDGDSAAQLQESLRRINPYVQFITNSVARGVEDFSDLDPSDLPAARTTEEGEVIRPQSAEANEELRRRLEEMRQREQSESEPPPDIMLDLPQAPPSVTGIFSDLPGASQAPQSDFMDSPTLIPSDQDRELARRLRGGIGGLGGVV